MIPAFVVSLLFSGAYGVSAQLLTPSPELVQTEGQRDGWTLVPSECLGPEAAVNCGFEQALQLVANIIGLLLVVALLLSALLFGYAGFTYATSAGDPGKVKTAKGIFTSVAKGLIIVFLAYTIVQVVISIFGVQQEYNIFLQRFQ